jgi:hypothetical protein
MNRKYAVVAVVISALALFLPTRTQTFTRASVEGRTMRMLVAGSGDTTVVFESGLAAPLETWGKVQPQVSRFARTVAYDRAGNGLSQHGPRPRRGIRAFSDPGARCAEGHDRAGAPAAARGSRCADRRRGSTRTAVCNAAIGELRSTRRREIEAESRAYATWVKTVPGARILVNARSGHHVPQEEPDVVADTIREVVQLIAVPELPSKCHVPAVLLPRTYRPMKQPADVPR